MTKVRASKPTETVRISVELEGIKPIMFDRYPGDNNTKLEVWQKMYLMPGDTKVIGLPAENIMSSLTAHNTNSYWKRLRDARQYKKLCNACLSFLEITPDFIPFMREGEPIRFGKFNGDGLDNQSRVWTHHAVARLEKGIPNPKERPVLPLPWSLEFEFTFFPNREIKEVDILNVIEEGGRAIGLGTFRGRYGKFRVAKWE